MARLILFLCLLTFLFSCKNTPTFNDPIPNHDSVTITSTFLHEDRVINVWTPPGYDNSNDSLPVLYMPDGGINEDFPHIANTLAKLIKEEKVPPFILVGIENTDRHRDLSGFSEVKEDEKYCPLTDGAKNFRAFIAKELMPQIESRYRTQNHKGIIGESLAGLFVMETFFISTETFDFYIAMDPSVWWNDHYLVKNVDSLLTSLAESDIKLWFAGSDAEDISQYTNSIGKSLQKKAPKQLTWKYSVEPTEKHNTIFRATKEKAMIWTMNENK